MEKEKYLVFLGLASEIIFLQLAFIYAGRWADDHWGWGSAGLIGGSLLGLTIWFVHIYYAMKKFDRPESSGKGD